MSAARFVAVTAVVSAAVGLLAAWIARAQGVGINVWVSVGTALVVGMFGALWWSAPRRATPDGEGFEVVATEEADAVPEAVVVAPSETDVAEPGVPAPAGSGEPPARD